MPDVHAPDGVVPELGGAVRGAVSVVCHSPFDLECLYAIADLAPRPPASPLGSLAATLAQSSSVDWRGWWAHWRAGGRQMPGPETPLGATTRTPNDVDVGSETAEPPDSDLETLKRVLAALYHVWQAQDAEDIPWLSCCVSVASESETPNGVAWTGAQPVLAFGLGTLRALLGPATWTARGFIAGLVLGGGIDVASRSAELVRRAREVAIRRQRARNPQSAVLPDIRTVVRPAGAANPLCILIHGLCSTDVGTFDDFEARIRTRSGKAPNATVDVVGFPHDSLTTTIDANARELAQHIVRLQARQCRLVCHSRGGLVARRTAAWLGREAAADPWIQSCVTFGTPHLGTSVASSPGQLTALLMSVAHLSRSPGAHSVVDVLCGVRAGQTYVGVSELVPSGVAGSYLAGLEQLENRLFLDDGFPLRVFGSTGRLARRSLSSWLIERVLGTGEHDLLVPIASSVPPLRAGHGANARVADRTHFEYFSTQLGADPPFWQDALTFMGLPAA